MHYTKNQEYNYRNNNYDTMALWWTRITRLLNRFTAKLVNRITEYLYSEIVCLFVY